MQVNHLQSVNKKGIVLFTPCFCIFFLNFLLLSKEKRLFGWERNLLFLLAFFLPTILSNHVFLCICILYRALSLSLSLSLSPSLLLYPSSIPGASQEQLSFLWSFPITFSILFMVFNRMQKGTTWFCFGVIAGQSISEKVLLSLSFHFWSRG